MKVKDVLTAYQRNALAEGKHCPEAQYNRRFTFGLFLADFGERDVAELQPFHLTDWIEARTSWKSSSTRRLKCAEIRAVFTWAARQGRIPADPFKGVSYRPADPRPEMPEEVIDRLCLLGSKPFEHMIRFLRLTMCRVSEACRAQWDHVDLERGIWVIPEHKTKKRTRRAKVVALVAEAVELLRAMATARAVDGTAAAPRQKADRATAATATPVVAETGTAAASHVLAAQAAQADGGGVIFRNTRGRPWQPKHLRKALQRLKDTGKVKTVASLHGIRHRAISAAIAAGAPITLVAAQAGHSDIATTQRYVHLESAIEEIRAAAQLGVPEAKPSRRPRAMGA
jgi:integrase